MKVKTFYYATSLTQGTPLIEDQMNDWLEEKQDRNIHSVKYNTVVINNHLAECAMVIYYEP